jgi:hypothetical protein
VGECITQEGARDSGKFLKGSIQLSSLGAIEQEAEIVGRYCMAWALML